MTDKVVRLRGRYSVIGRGMIIHHGTDDLGLVGDEGTIELNVVHFCFIPQLDIIKFPMWSVLFVFVNNKQSPFKLVLK